MQLKVMSTVIKKFFFFLSGRHIYEGVFYQVIL